MIKKVIAIVGATNSGKTAVAVKLAKEINGIIISADSRQVYKGLNVGTNKEGEASSYLGYSARNLNGVEQLLIDQVTPPDRFTLNEWLILARRMIEDIWQNGQVPIVVGGTGLYVSALLEGYQLGMGRYAKPKAVVDFESLVLMPKIDREILYKKSDDRIMNIFDELVTETKGLRKNEKLKEWLKNIGLDYRFASNFLDGEITKVQAIEQLQQASRAYIRRQQTWWRHHGEVHEFSNYSEVVDLVDDFLNS